MLTIRVAATDHQGPVNEDVVGHWGDAAWVIDGATGIGAALLDAPSDAAWLAQAMDANFRQILEETPAVSTRALVRQAILRCRTAFQTGSIRAAEGPHEHPSAAFAMLRRFDSHIELTGLGDCCIVYEDDAGVVQQFSDTSLTVIEGRSLARVRNLLAAEPSLGPQELFQRLLPQLWENRNLMNKEGGYWVLGIEPAAADHLVSRILPCRAGQRFALASDGFLRLTDVFSLARSDDLLAIDSEDAWQAWLNRLRTIERAPESFSRHHRIKVHDDATFVHLEI